MSPTCPSTAAAQVDPTRPPARRVRAHPAGRVLVLDTHQMVAAALRSALREAGLDAHQLLVGDHDSVLLAAAGYPDGPAVLALGLDPWARPTGPAELVAALTAQGQRTLVLTEDPEDAATAIAAGAIGVVPKSASFDTLLRCVTRALAGRPLLTDAERARWLARHEHLQRSRQRRARALARLTHREREVLELLATGHRATAIAAQLAVAVPTVRTQIRSVLTKLKVNTQLEAVALLSEAAPRRGGDRDTGPGGGTEAEPGGARR